MYDNEEDFLNMNYSNNDPWTESEENDLSDDGSSALAGDQEDLVFSGENEERSDDLMGPLDVFKAADDLTKVSVLKKIFTTKEQKEFIDIYKEEEASQAELTKESEWGDNIDDSSVKGDDYYFLRYMENHPKLWEEREEEVAEALELE